MLAGESQPHGGTVRSTGPVGYLPQDPREGDLVGAARDRVLSARGLDQLLRDMEKVQTAMAELADDAERDKAVARYGRLETRFADLGGYAAESEAARICPTSACPTGCSPSRSRRSPVASAAGWSSPASCSPPRGRGQRRTTLLLDEPTNHLDADSISWLRGFLKATRAGW